MEATAFVTATTTNREDFEESKKLFKETLEEAMRNAQAEAQVQIYKEAINGFLLDLGQSQDSTLEFARRIRNSTVRLKRLSMPKEPSCGFAAILWKPCLILSLCGFGYFVIKAIVELIK